MELAEGGTGLFGRQAVFGFLLSCQGGSIPRKLFVNFNLFPYSSFKPSKAGELQSGVRPLRSRFRTWECT